MAACGRRTNLLYEDRNSERAACAEQRTAGDRRDGDRSLGGRAATEQVQRRAPGDPTQPESAAIAGTAVAAGGDGNNTSAGYAGMHAGLPVAGTGGGGGGGGGGYVVFIGTHTGSGAICPAP